MDHYDDLYVLSDLHLGGKGKFQIFRQTDLLRVTIDKIAADEPGSRVGLVLCGDVVDFLAETPFRYFDAEKADEKLWRIAVKDPSFKPVFDALCAFVRTPGRVLTVVLGNHDVELALPRVRETLLSILTGGDAAARGRIRLAFDGAGYRCSVHGEQVLCFHGERNDGWNLVDHDRLRRIARAQNHGVKPPHWEPNAGTQLVIDVMNDIKRELPFVDLLKPETEACLPLLACLKPAVAGDVDRVLALRAKQEVDRHRWQLLGSPKEAGQQRPAFDGVSSLAGLIQVGLEGSEQDDEDIMAWVEAHIAEDPVRLARLHEPGATLGLKDDALDWLRGLHPREILRRLLAKRLLEDRSFYLTEPDAPYKLVMQHHVGAVGFVVAGHTHLRRHIRGEEGTPHYLNAGTWIALIKLEYEHVVDKKEFAELYDNLRADSVDELVKRELVKYEPTLVHIGQRRGKVTGRLLEAAAEGDTGVSFREVENQVGEPS